MSRIRYIENMTEWASSFQFKHRVKVRFSETDMFGHVNNSVPFTYFEVARIEYFKRIGFMQYWLGEGAKEIPVVADLQCDFVEQLFFDDDIDVHVKATRIGNSSVDLHYMGTKEGKVCFTGRGTIVQISKKTGKSVAWTEEMKQKMGTF
ncbi:acyl-CoA thioesterase [Bacillus cihuensis]|uniref:acyl-CoA thioesterase n=1 Tax=Bacillus cihuensis TaxID=1208599 RepID=UPI0003FD1FAD|nr:thioesterase family protein [Bacillus cihuensis]